MPEGSKKGPLIQKKPKSNSLERPQPIKVTSQNDFKFSNSENEVSSTKFKPENNLVKSTTPVRSTSEPIKIPDKVLPSKAKSVVGKNNNVKSIKVPQDLHIKIGVLGKFMDQNKTYAILDELIRYYSENELTDRQKKQFEYMTEFFHED